MTLPTTTPVFSLNAFIRFAPLVAVLALVSCASAPQAVKTEPEPAPVAAKPLALPDQELDERTLYRFLIGEIAQQRGDLGLAAESYGDLASTTRDPRIAQRATEMAYMAGQKQKALQAARLWLELSPDSIQAAQAMAGMLIDAGRFGEARPLLEKMLTTREEAQGHAFMRVGNLITRAGDKNGALVLLQEVIKPHDQIPEAHFILAHAAWQAGQMDLALASVRQALRLRPEWDTATVLQGQLLQRAAPADALAYYQDYLRDYPRAKEVRLGYARLLVAEKRFSEAREEFQRLMRDFPGNADVTAAVGLLSIQLKDYDQAEAVLRQAMKEGYRDENSLRVYLGQLDEERKRYEAAAQWYGSVSGGEQHLYAQIRHAAMLARLGRLGDARAHLQKIALQNNQQRVQVVLAEAQILRDARQYQEAYDVLGRALEKLPNYPDLLYDHAMAAEKVNRPDIMEQNLRKLIQQKPDHAHAYNALGYSLADRNERLDEARTLLEKALSLAPDDPFIIDSMGWMYYRLGDNDKAASYLRRALEARPDPEIAAHLGEVLWMQGKRDEAIGLWQMHLKDNPDNDVLQGVIKKFNP